MAREILQRLAAADDLNIRCRQAFLGMIFQHRLQLTHISHHLAAHPAPTYWFRFFCALSADVNNIVFNFLRTEF